MLEEGIFSATARAAGNSPTFSRRFRINRQSISMAIDINIHIDIAINMERN
jgi:hypothetical protein